MEMNESAWVRFSGIMMMIGGIANFIWGIAAVAKDTLLGKELLFFNLTTWSVIAMILGPVLAFAGVAVLYSQRWAVTFGMIWASLSIVFWLLVIWAFPALSILVITMDTLVIFGLGDFVARTA